MNVSIKSLPFPFQDAISKHSAVHSHNGKIWCICLSPFNPVIYINLSFGEHPPFYHSLLIFTITVFFAPSFLLVVEHWIFLVRIICSISYISFSIFHSVVCCHFSVSLMRSIYITKSQAVIQGTQNLVLLTNMRPGVNHFTFWMPVFSSRKT